MALSFDATYYLSQRPDVFNAFVATNGSTGLSWAQFAERHYNNFGRFEGSNPNTTFNTLEYLKANPDVAAAGVNPFTHYLNFGINEGRAPSASFPSFASFDSATYLNANADLKAAGITTAQQAYAHFVRFGQFEGRPGAPTVDTGVVGSTLTLTAGVDTIVGTANNDTIRGDVTFSDAAASVATGSFSVADQITGGAGTDTLNITVAGGGTTYTTAALPAATLSGIEILNVRAVQAETGDIVTVNAAVPGLTQVNADRSTSTVSVTGLVAGAAVGVTGDGVTANGAVNFAYGAANPAVTVNVRGGTTGTASNITNTDAASAVTSAVINSTGAANTVGTLELDGDTVTDQITSLTVNAATNLTATLTADDFAATGVLTVSGGAASVNLGSGFDGATINAAGLTAGGLTVGLTTNTTSFVGGQGNDIVTTAALGAGVAASAVNAGAGTADRLVVGATTDVDTSAEALRYAGFEVLDAGSQTVNLALFTNSAIDALRVGGAATLNNVSAAQAANITQYASGSATIEVSGAATVGQIDTVKITADDGAAATSTIALGTPVLAGVENLQLVAVDNLTVTALTSAPALTSVTASGAGTVGITTGAVAFAANTSINASAATGVVTIDASAATTNGIAITGGSANDTLNGSALADKIVGGAGNDILGSQFTLTAGAVSAVAASTAGDVLTGGAGNDTFALGSSAVANISTITDLNLGTNALSGAADRIVFDLDGGAATTTVITLNATQQTAVTAAGSLALAAAEVLKVAGADGNVATFTYGTDTYLIANGDGNGTYDAAADGLVKITGFTGVLDASDITLI